MRSFSRWLPAILICCLIFYFSSQQGLSVSEDYNQNFVAQKSAHVILYFTLCFCFYRATKSIPLAILLSMFYAISDEVHQHFVPTRSGQFSDVILDTVAASFAGLILWKFYPNLPKILKNWLKA